MLSKSQDISSETSGSTFDRNFKSSVDLSKINIKVTKISESVDRSNYVNMKECLTCNTSLGKQGSKKYYCKFCYNAVCAACSPLNIMHPESGKEEKTCNPCYINYLKLIVLESGEEYVKAKLKQLIEEKEVEINLRKQIIELEKIKEDSTRENDEFNMRLSLREKELKEKDSKILQQEEENKKITDFLNEMIKKGKIDNFNEDEAAKVFKKASNQASDRSSTCIDCLVF